MQKSLPSVLPKRVYAVILRMHNKSAQRKPAKHKKTSHDKIYQSKVQLLSIKGTTWKQGRDNLASESGLQLIKVITNPVINHLSCYGSVCPHSCLSVQRKYDYPVSYKAGTSKVSNFTRSHVPN